MSQSIEKTQYKLMSICSGAIFDDEGWTLEAPHETTPGLVRAMYENR